MARKRAINFNRHFQTRVVLPGALVILGITLICGLGLVSAGRAIDSLSLQGQQYEAYRSMFRGMDDLSLGQEAVAVSDAVHANVVNPRGNRDWLDENVGFWLYDLHKAHETYILGADDRPIYASIRRRQSDENMYAGVASAIQPFVDLVRSRVKHPSNWNSRLPGSPVPAFSSVKTSARAIHDSDLAMLRGRPAIVSVMRITPLSSRIAYDSARTPLLVNIRYIDKLFLLDATRQNYIAFPRLSNNPRTGKGESAIPVMSSDAKLLFYLIWRPQLPGTQLIQSMLPSATAAILLFAAVLIALSFKLRRLMAKDDRHMTELEAAHLELRASEAQAHHLAHHDTLTGLANRALFNGNVDKALARVRAQGSAAILLLDLDRFKNVNDRFGHLAGDALIQEVARRLAAILGNSDSVARLGGDEFAILIEDGAQAAAIEPVIQRILEALRRPFDVLGNQAFIGASIGVAIAPDSGVERTELMRKADIALYRAKDEGRDCYRIFSEAMDETVQLRSTLEAELREALAQDTGLCVHYQPQLDGTGNKIIGLEALVRWQHPTRGMISPHLFVPVAEETGLIVSLGEWVLRQACGIARMWPNLSIAVNLSPVQFRSEGVVDRICAIVAEAGVDARQIELEVTEGVLLDNDEHVRQGLRRLRAEGYRIALDDFGTGYSSLSYLRKFDVDKIKIDKSFVQHLGHTMDAAAIVTAVVTLGHAMGLTVTAEGVETADQKDFLRSAGCNELQGYLFSHPVPPSEIAGILSAHEARRHAA